MKLITFSNGVNKKKPACYGCENKDVCKLFDAAITVPLGRPYFLSFNCDHYVEANVPVSGRGRKEKDYE